MLRCFADEEAAKVLILLDVARAGWQRETECTKLMKWFYQHLARGLYVQAYHGHPADLAEVRRYVDGLRPEFYLDGPNDVDWIFRNEVLAQREERLYVDYVWEEDGTGHWTDPAERAARSDEMFDYPEPSSHAVRLVNAMSHLGLLSERGLETAHKAWFGVTVVDATHWSEIFELNCAVVDALDVPDTEDNRAAASIVCNYWTFPMYDLDLSSKKVAVAELQEVRLQRLELLEREFYGDIF